MLVSSTAATLMTMMSLISMMLLSISKKKKMSKEKNSPFECGFNPISSPRKPFSSHFFLIAIMFLIFDIEISIILPMTSTKMMNMKEWTLSTIMIITMLTMGIIHEWNNKMIEWSN